MRANSSGTHLATALADCRISVRLHVAVKIPTSFQRTPPEWLGIPCNRVAQRLPGQAVKQLKKTLSELLSVRITADRLRHSSSSLPTIRVTELLL